MPLGSTDDRSHSTRITRIAQTATAEANRPDYVFELEFDCSSHFQSEAASKPEKGPS